MILAGCASKTNTETATGNGTTAAGTTVASTEAQKPFEVVIARSFDVAGMDPGFLKENAQVVDNIFDRLVMRDTEMKLIPGLATEWSQVDDLTWEFKLRQGVKFHNGEDFNAEAVKFSIDRVLDPASNAPTLSYISTIDSVEVVDDYTVRVKTKTPDPLIPTRFSRYPTEVVPPKYVKEVGNEVFAQKPVGTGPYKFVEWVKDDRVVLEANQDYWNGVPAVTKVTWRSIPESSTRIGALLAGEVDIATPVAPQDIETVSKSDKVRISKVERGGNIVYVGLKTDEKPFTDVRVRQALNYAIDRDSIVKSVLTDTAVKTFSMIGPKDFGYDGEPAGYTYDSEKAKKLLAEAGYPNGFETSLDCVNWYIKCTDVGQAIAAQLAQVGIKIKVNSIESSVYRTSVPAKKQAPMYFLGWSSTNSLDADAAIYAVLHSGQSYSTYSNAEVDKMLDSARSSTKPEERSQLYSSIQKNVIEDAPRIFLYQENKYIGVSNKIDWEGRIDDAIPVATMKAK
jgi:ABC-type dipeptide transport system, periplasmic component